MSATSDIAACRELMRGGSRTFFAASLVLPRSVADPAIALYAFCRLADDAVDCDGGAHDAVARLRDRLDRAYRGQPLPTPADRAFADVVARFAVPRALPEALLEGLQWDIDGRRYETLDDLLHYAVRVAGTVGAMMALLMQRRDPAIVARACDLGIAMQLTNIARDVGEDARAGRLYLPRAWMADAGLDADAWLADPKFDSRMAQLVARLLGVADGFYRRSIPGIAALPASCRTGIHAARLIYAEIGREVERRGCDSVSQRAVVPARRKMRLLAEAAAHAVRPRDTVVDSVEPSARFLVEAVAASPAIGTLRGRSPVDSVVWVLDLFERLERRDQMLRSGGAR